MKTYSLSQVRQMLHVDNKTLAAWLERAGIALQKSEHDKRVKRITQEQLDQLASIHERPIGELPVEREVHPTVKALERQVSEQGKQLKAMQARLEALEQRLAERPRSAPRAQRPAEHQATSAPDTTAGESSALPSDLVSARSFGARHGIAENTVNKAIATKRLPIVSGRWKVGSAYVQKALDQAGRDKFFVLYRGNQNFHQCDEPTCPCHV